MFDFRLKVFHTVATNLSFTKASEELYISQPAVTKHIKEIEKTLAIRLFERKGNKILLTEAGNILLKKTRKIFDIYSELEYEIGELRGNISGKLKLGASSTIAQWVIPEILSKFSEAYPAVRISLMNGNSLQIEEALLENKIDLGIVEGNKTRKDLRYNIFKSDSLISVVSAEKKLSALDVITIDEFKALPLVLREQGSGTLDVILKALNDKFSVNLNDLNIAMHLGSTESIKTYLYHSDTMAVISCCAVSKEIDTGLLKEVKIKGLKFKRHFRFVCPHGSQKILNEKFMTFAKQHYDS